MVWFPGKAYIVSVLRTGECDWWCGFLVQHNIILGACWGQESVIGGVVSWCSVYWERAEDREVWLMLWFPGTAYIGSVLRTGNCDWTPRRSQNGQGCPSYAQSIYPVLKHRIIHVPTRYRPLVVLHPNSDLGVDLALESTQCFFDVYDTLLSTDTESGWCHSGTLGAIEILKMAAADLKNILITINSLLMVPETFSPCLVIGLVTQGIWSTMSQRHTMYGYPRWPPLTWKISKWP